MSESNKVIKSSGNLLLSWGLVYFSLLIIIIGTTLSKTVADRFEGASVQRFTDPIFLLGYILLVIRGFSWFLALRTIPLSKAYPVLSLSFPMILIVAAFMFGEPITINKCIGSTLIVAGVIIIGRK
jgi:drug/metabolite transporter (DMT)-like permease